MYTCTLFYFKLTFAQIIDIMEEDDNVPDSNVHILPPDDGNDRGI